MFYRVVLTFPDGREVPAITTSDRCLARAIAHCLTEHRQHDRGRAVIRRRRRRGRAARPSR